MLMPTKFATCKNLSRTASCGQLTCKLNSHCMTDGVIVIFMTHDEYINHGYGIIRLHCYRSVNHTCLNMCGRHSCVVASAVFDEGLGSTEGCAAEALEIQRPS